MCIYNVTACMCYSPGMLIYCVVARLQYLITHVLLRQCKSSASHDGIACSSFVMRNHTCSLMLFIHVLCLSVTLDCEIEKYKLLGDIVLNPLLCLPKYAHPTNLMNATKLLSFVMSANVPAGVSNPLVINFAY